MQVRILGLTHVDGWMINQLQLARLTSLNRGVTVGIAMAVNLSWGKTHGFCFLHSFHNWREFPNDNWHSHSYI